LEDYIKEAREGEIYPALRSREIKIFWSEHLKERTGTVIMDIGVLSKMDQRYILMSRKSGMDSSSSSYDPVIGFLKIRRYNSYFIKDRKFLEQL
jgi:hypothetical protein